MPNLRWRAADAEYIVDHLRREADLACADGHEEDVDVVIIAPLSLTSKLALNKLVVRCGLFNQKG